MQKLNPIISKRQLGRFKISRFFIDYGDISAIMEHLIIIRAEYIGYLDYIEYTAFSGYFEPIEEGQEVPFYEFILTKKGRKMVISAVRRDVK